MIPILFLFLCFLKIPHIISEGLRCKQILGGDALFTLETLSSPTDYTFNFTSDDVDYTLYYNFCFPAQLLCRNLSAYTILVPLESETKELNFDKCITASNDSLTSNYEYSLIDPNDASGGMQLLLKNGQFFSESTNYETYFKFSCDNDQNDFKIDSINFIDNKLEIIGHSKQGCPVLQLSAIYNFIVNNKYILGCIMIIIGGIECFFGLAMLGPSLFSIGFFTGFGFLLILFGEFMIKPTTNSYLVWTLIVICIAVGICLGYLATSLPKIGFFALGIWLGVVIAFIINSLFLYEIETEPQDLLLYLLMLVLGVSGAFLSKWKWKSMCIISTSVLGAYLTIRGLSVFIGYYPDEFNMAQRIRNKEIDGVPWVFYLYLSLITFLTICGIYFQFKNKKKGGRFNGDFGLGKDEEENTKGLTVEIPLLDKQKTKDDV